MTYYNKTYNYFLLLIKLYTVICGINNTPNILNEYGWPNEWNKSCELINTYNIKYNNRIRNTI